MTTSPGNVLRVVKQSHPRIIVSPTLIIRFINSLAQHPTRADVIATGQVASIVDGHSANPYDDIFTRISHFDEFSVMGPWSVSTNRSTSPLFCLSCASYICVYDWSSKQCWQLPALHQRRVCALAFSADGKYLASAGTFQS
jgi:WD40 repeat protein